MTDPGAHREHVLRTHGRALALHAVASMLLRPGLAACFLRTRAGLYARKLLPRRRPSSAVSRPGRQHASAAVLTHVAVAPDAQSHGLGSRMIGWFDAEVADAGCTRMMLVTASGEDGAAPYYRRRGWQSVGERRTPDGLQLTTFVREVEAVASAETSTRREDTA